MKTRSVLLFPIVCITAATLVVQAQDKSKSSKSEPTETQLELKMEEINLAFRRLNRQVGNAAKNADSLKQVAVMQENANAALKLEPKLKTEIPPAQQKKFVADYQAQMKEFVADIGKLQTALKAGKNAEAESMLKTLKKHQEEGHNMFRKKKDSDKKEEKK